MARKIRFSLKLKDGTEARTIEELQAHFDLESVLGYFLDGRLYTWLADRYYDDKAEAVNALSKDMPDLNQKLCEIFGVEYHDDNTEDLEVIQRRKEKLDILNFVTDNKEILDNVDFVAMNQDELFDILDESPEKIYLYGEKFSIPFGKGNVTYIGVNNPVILLEKSVWDYKAKEICFEKTRFDEKSYEYAENLFITGKQKEAFPLIEQAANNGNSRAMYVMARYYNDGYEIVKIDTEKRNTWCKKAFDYDEPVSMYGYVSWVNEQEAGYQKVAGEIKKLAELGDALSQGILGYMYDSGNGVPQDYTKAVEWYRKAAEQGYAVAQKNLGVMYEYGTGVPQDYTKAVELYRKTAERGYARAQCSLGVMYANGTGVPQDYTKAVEWFRKAAEQELADAQLNLGVMYANGYGVPQSETKAVEWYRKAAEQGNETAKKNLERRGIYI